MEDNPNDDSKQMKLTDRKRLPGLKMAKTP